jgi:radical SAM superfamily enzyme YgiQ (UPF0313 family)
VLLINPWIYDFAAYDLWAKPYGLLLVGSVLRRNGLRVRLIDCLGPDGGVLRKPFGHGKFPRQRISKPPEMAFVPRTYARYGITPGEFLKRLSEGPTPDAVLVTSMMTYWYPGVLEAIRLVRENLPSVPVVLGGVYATLCTEHALRTSGADHVVESRGEVRVLELMHSMWGFSPGYIPDEKDLDTLPYPCFDLVEGLKSVCIRTVRGCSCGCPYCASRYLSGPMAFRRPDKVADEIEFWHGKHGVEDFAFIDDALLAVRPRAHELLREIRRRSPGVRLHCPNALSVRAMDLETARLMKDAGIVTVRLGLETSDPARQNTLGGKVTNYEFERALEALHRAGYPCEAIGVYVLCGLPGQEPEEVIRTVEYVAARGARPKLAEYSPIPHTALWPEAVRASPFALETEPLFHNNTLMPCASERLKRHMAEIRRSTFRYQRSAV